jgi:hypothetical protein
MPMRRIVATQSYRYRTRRLVAGDEFEVPEMVAQALVGARRARFADAAGPQHPPQPSPPVPPPQPVREPHPDDDEDEPDTDDPDWSRSSGGDLDTLRAKARQLGIMVDGRWGTTRLLHEINLRR